MTTASDGSDADVIVEKPAVLVLGAGCAGVMAAAAAQRALSANGATGRGDGVDAKRVVVVHKGGGATALSSGAVDVADPDRGAVPGPGAGMLEDGLPAEPARPRSDWRLGMRRLAAEKPRHPYARLRADAADRMDEALQLLDDVAIGLDFARREGTNLIVGTELGTLKPTAMTHASAGFDLRELPVGGHVLVADPADVAGFDGTRVAETLAWAAMLGGRPLRFDVLPLPSLAEGPPRTARQLASLLDREGTDSLVTGLADALRSALADRSAGPAVSAVLFPGVLGVKNHPAVRAQLEEACGVAVHELLSMPPSAAGARLTTALFRGLVESGVDLVEGEARSTEKSPLAQTDGEAVTAVEVLQRPSGPGPKSQERLVRYEPAAVVLATGRFLSGGLRRDGDAAEPLFGLPLVADGQLVADRFIGELTADVPDGDHSIFRAGVPWDDQLRPRSLSGAVHAANLFACGSVLEGYDPARDTSGLGVAALTGMLAGERAAALVGER